MDLNNINDVESLLKTQETLMGRNSREVANTLNRLSQLYFEKEEFELAEKCMQRSLDIKVSVYGPVHKEVLVILERFSTQLRQQQRNAEAEDVETTAERVRLKIGPSVSAKRAISTETQHSEGAMSDTGSSPVVSNVQRKSIHEKKHDGPQLTIESSGQQFCLRKTNVWIGRDVSNDISFANDSSVEKSHAMIVYEPDQYWIINRALASCTMLNGKPVTRKTKLTHGDVVSIANHAIRFLTM
jgi:hypothetical protein